VPGHREIEIKLRVADLGQIIGKIRSLGARTRGRVHEYNALFDTPDLGFWRTGRLLRLRVETPAASRPIPAGRRGAWLTSKVPAPARARGSRSLFKERLESEVSVANPLRFLRRIARLGFRRGFCYEKYRTPFRIPGLNLHIDLDETPVGVILELEGSPYLIRSVARRLGFSRRDYLRSTYGELYAAECRRRGIPPGNMLFGAKKSRKAHSLLDKLCVSI
jgi:adenylate cyclase, class 2